MTVADGLADLSARGIDAVPVQTLRDLVDRHRSEPTRTVRFEVAAGRVANRVLCANVVRIRR